MSDSVSVGPASARPTVEGRVSGANLFAASAKNALPRLLSSLTMTAVACVYVGWLWGMIWLAASTATLLVSVRLTRHGRPSPQATRILHINSGVSTLIQCVMIVALWQVGDVEAKAFALASAFIGGTYTLLQFYANVGLFRLLLAPYVLSMAYMALEAAWRTGFKPAALITAGAAALGTANFFILSRRLLARSRNALRKARSEAQAGELAAEAANAAKSTFLATMSHEIRTPLNGVLGMAQAMAGDRLSAVQRERLSVIHQSGESLLAILNDVLDLSKIEAGKLELETIEFDLGEVVRGAYSAFTALANKKGLSFAVHIEEARGRYLGDPTRVRQILYNLISNALKFTEAGEVRVTATRREGMLELAVTDTGAGIAPASLAKLFAKFEQMDSSTTRRFGGTGLGLAICRELAELMGGEMAVESKLGEGSTFIFRAPFVHLGAERTAAEYAPPPPAGRPHLPLRVLAAEDNAVNQLVLKTLLHQLGVEPVVVESGAQALQAWEDGDWDVVLMDIQMPDMDGITAAEAIRARERETGRVRTPIVALSANAMAHQVEQYLAAGMDGHVAKPIQAMTLFEVLVQAVEARDDAEAAASASAA